MFAELYSRPERIEQFMDAMSGISAANFQAFADKFDFSRYHSLCDIGGATGQLSMLVAKKHPHLRCISADLPAATRIAERKISAAGLVDRVSTTSLDFFAEPLPKADVITMGMILHDWNLEKKMYLVRAAYDALSAGGAFVVIQNLIDDARRKNARATYVAKYVDRVRRCLRFHGRRFLRLVSGGGLQQNRGDSIGRARK